jgi:hypothetical protein
MHYGTWVDSASNRNEYHESSWDVKGWPHRHLWPDCLENVAASMSHKPTSLHGLLEGQL